MRFERIAFSSLFAEPQKNGLTRPKAVRGSGLPMVNMGELFAHRRIRHMKMDRVLVKQSESAYILCPGDLLFARQSLVLSGAGKCSLFDAGDEPTVFESHLIRCRLDRTKADSRFYFYFFGSPQGRAVIESIVEQGAGQSGIRASDLARLLVPQPPAAYQSAVANLLSTLDDRIDSLRVTSVHLEAIARTIFKSWFVDFDQ